MSDQILNGVNEGETQNFPIDLSMGSQAIIQVDKGTILAEILKDGVHLEKQIVSAGSSKSFDFTNFSSDHKFTLVITGIAPTESEFKLSGNAG